MRHYRLKQEERAGIGFTDLFVLTHADLTEAADNTVQAVVLSALAVGDLVMNNTLLEVRTNANVVAAVTASVGVVGALEQFVANSNLLAAGSEYFTVINTVAPYVATAAVDMVANFIPGANDNLLEITAGEFWIWATINRRAERNVQV